MGAVVKPADSLLIVDSLHGKITVIIKSLRSISGNLNIALYDSYKAFASKETPFRGAFETVADYTMTVLFDSIPKGVYAIAVFHDEDKDGVLKTNKMNIPMEGYGFSNNIVASFSPPEYSQIRFYFSGKNKTVVINMVYLKLPK
jgi:uncharacterized protein (DUF2141 family)